MQPQINTDYADTEQNRIVKTMRNVNGSASDLEYVTKSKSPFFLRTEGWGDFNPLFTPP